MNWPSDLARSARRSSATESRTSTALRKRAARTSPERRCIVRLPSFVVSTEVVFGLPDERLTIRHDAGATPEPYVAGTLIAVRRAPGLVGLTRFLDALRTAVLIVPSGAITAAASCVWSVLWTHAAATQPLGATATAGAMRLSAALAPRRSGAPNAPPGRRTTIRGALDRIPSGSRETRPPPCRRRRPRPSGSSRSGPGAPA